MLCLPFCMEPGTADKNLNLFSKGGFMKRFFYILAIFVFTSGTGLNGGMAMAEDAKQTITRQGSQAAIKGSSEFFTGNVTIRPLFGAKHPEAPFGAAYVTFEPGARSHWHTHPAGQHLIVTDGVGRTGTEDGTVEEFGAGDVLWCPKDVKHWHGASPTMSMTHIALTGTLADGKNVEWMEPVTDEQYKGGK